MKRIELRRPMPGTLILAGLAILVVLGAFAVSDGLYNLDEFMIAASAEAMRSHGSLVYDNGYAAFGSESLRLWQFVAGPHGLVPQYPVGPAVLGAPLMDMLGIRGLILLNALAAAATLFATRQLARELFDDERIAFFAPLLLSLGTFWPEFAYGVWPHAMGAFFVVCALVYALKAINADARGAARWALLSGLAIGAGLLLRVDTILILPSIGLCIYLFGRHVLQSSIAGIIGLAPGVAIMSLVNHYKFGSYNPLSYGQQGGSTDISMHAAAIGAVALTGLALLCAKRIPWHRVPKMAIVGTLIGILGLACAFPAPRDYLWRYLHGFWALLVDAGAIHDTRSGVGANADGVLFFWGMVKKALGQSMPWIGALFVLAMKPREGKHGRALAITAIVFGLWSLPFIVKAWHGGLGSNMRYFLPLLPLLCVMAVAAWLKLCSITGGTSSRMALLTGLAGGLLAVLLWAQVGPSGVGGAQQIMATYLLLATCLTCSLLRFAEDGHRPIAWAAQFLVAAGFSVAMAFGLLDLSASQARRYLMARTSDALSAIPPPSLLVGSPEKFTFQIGRPHGLVALPTTPTSNEIDLDLLRAAIGAGYAVYAPPRFVAAVAEMHPEFRIGPRSYISPGGEMLEISLWTAGAEEASATPSD